MVPRCIEPTPKCMQMEIRRKLRQKPGWSTKDQGFRLAPVVALKESIIKRPGADGKMALRFSHNQRKMERPTVRMKTTK